MAPSCPPSVSRSCALDSPTNGVAPRQAHPPPAIAAPGYTEKPVAEAISAWVRSAQGSFDASTGAAFAGDGAAVTDVPATFAPTTPVFAPVLAGRRWAVFRVGEPPPPAPPARRAAPAAAARTVKTARAAASLRRRLRGGAAAPAAPPTVDASGPRWGPARPPSARRRSPS